MSLDMYNTFDNNNIPYSYPTSYKDNPKEYMVGDEPYACWNYGDSTKLEFIVPASFDLDSTIFYLTVNNFRYEPIIENAELELDEDESLLIYNISADISKEIFKKGVYYIKVYAEEVVNDTNYITTFINNKLIFVN